MSNFDSSDLSTVSDKIRMLYFARQLWHDYLTRLLIRIGNGGEDVAIVVNAIKVLHTATAKGIVNLIRSFPINKFAKVA